MKEDTWTSDEWVMVSDGDPQKYIIGKVHVSKDLYDAFAPSGAPDNPATLRVLLDEFSTQNIPVPLIKARILITLMQAAPGKGLQLATQVLPISISFCPATVYVQAKMYMLPADMRGMESRIEDLMKEVDQQESVNNAREAGLVIPSLEDVRRKV